ncbi:hypothetical protein [Christiangramia flava]|uniref:DUF7793 domain-containing protein n=1 Tax=Christiangramia flava JLT2011 TaxID=1229726 RepID=A0A1L7I8B0_9FLAO|nr:hypothetical protein [Christiangramia flava]APU69826.1 hypothetical protein GRFL_3102 [Christiangramia flava JLT2011]OSS39141.1 hypothetical protein C723_1687 [Christiangramia flava JLT2011]
MVVDGTYAKMWISDGILYFVYKEIYEINRSMAKEIVSQRLQLQNEDSYPIFCDLRAVTNAEKEARDYLAIEGAYMTKALALLVEDEHALAISQLFIRTASPDYPTRVFTDKRMALLFLEDYK